MHEFADMEGPIHFRREVLDGLLEFGAAPTEETQPRVPYQFLRALMTFEIRGCKARRRELERVFGPQPLADYAGEIDLLREKYFLLRRPPGEWVEESSASLADAKPGEQSSSGGEQAEEYQEDQRRADPPQEESPHPDESLSD